MSFELSLEADPGQIVTAMLDANHPVVIVGRKRGSGLTTTNRTVSREHAEFRWQDGQIAVRDLDSTGGTFINGKRVQNGVLGLGDSVACGKLEVRIRDLGGSGASRRMTSEDSDGGGGGGDDGAAEIVAAGKLVNATRRAAHQRHAGIVAADEGAQQDGRVERDHVGFGGLEGGDEPLGDEVGFLCHWSGL